MKTKYKILLIVVLVLILALINDSRAQETVPQTQSILRSYFLTGYRPTQTNYWEFIDTMFWYANYCATNAAAAQQSAQSVQNFYPAFANFTFSVTTNVACLFTNSINVAQIVCTNVSTGPNIFVNSDGGFSGGWTLNAYRVDVTFLQPLAGTNYGVTLSSPGLAGVKTFYFNSQNYAVTPSVNWTNIYGTVTAPISTTGFSFQIDAVNSNALNGLVVSCFAQ